MSKIEIVEVFRGITNEIPKYLTKHAHVNNIDKKIPRHYDELSITATISNTHTIIIKLQRTVTGKMASYNDPMSIMDAFKRGHITIIKNGTVQAYDVHLRYSKEHQKYIPLLMDEKRIITLDEKHHAMDFIDDALYGKIKDMVPEKSTNKYPTKMIFSLKR